MRYVEPQGVEETKLVIGLLESGRMDAPKNSDMGDAWQGPGGPEEEAMTREEALSGLRSSLERLEAFEPGEVYDALNDEKRHEARAKQVDDMAKALVDLCEKAVDDMAQTADDEGDREFAEEVRLHETAFLVKLTKTAVHVALERWKDRRREAAVETLEGLS